MSSSIVSVRTSTIARISGASETVLYPFSLSLILLEISFTNAGFNASEPPAANFFLRFSSVSIWSFGILAPICILVASYPSIDSKINSVNSSTSSNKFSQYGQSVSSFAEARCESPSMIEALI